ncbi:hypothetical protein [Frigoribacterium sp. CG_9.8]|uniref:phage tail tube protein n=1 Tax=Frigoribacterium sp. CG_9.8 TaxID=2787733 RepID=UPI0018CB0DDD|nr:hypothetical protein [Frigoribacterium sp. CG_9.8]MBG6106640.1 hypothetical protein [Frigoribacterium sp. CG_9.8]
MPNKRVLTNKNLAWFFAPATAVANIKAITATEAATFINITDAAKLDGTNFNTKASLSADDRSFADAAGAKTSGNGDFGGSLSCFKAQDSDTTSTFRAAEVGIKPAGSDIIFLNRPVESASSALAAGHEYNAWHVLTDAPSDVRGASSYSWVVELLPQSDMAVRGIVAPAAAVAPTVSIVAGAASGIVSSVARLKAIYQGKNITVGAKWVTSDPSKATVSEHGIVQRIAVGTANISVTFPGALASTAVVITTTA